MTEKEIAVADAAANAETNANAVRMFESMWPGTAWIEASASDKRMFTAHAQSLSEFGQAREEGTNGGVFLKFRS